MKDLNKNWDFTLLINPLLSDQGPPMAVVPKLKKQIERMKKIRKEFLQQKQAEAMPDKPAGKMPDKPAGSFQTTRRRRAASREETQPDEGQNCGRMWSGGTCKKYISAGGHGCKVKKPRMDFNSSMEDLRYKHRTDVAQMLPGE